MQKQAVAMLEMGGVGRSALLSEQLLVRHVLSELVVPEDLPGQLREGDVRRRGGAVVEGTSGALLRLAEAPGVANVEEEITYSSNLNSVGSIVGADHAFQSGLTGRGVTVAVIDTGIDSTHPAFAGRISPLSCNFSTSSGPPTDFVDRDGHGTHVAGIVGGDGSPSGRLRGIAPGVQLLIVKAYASAQSGQSGEVFAAVNYAIQHGADVIMLSAGHAPWNPPAQMTHSPWLWSSRTTFEEMVFTAAPASGRPAIVAAGNSGNLATPSSTITRPGICEHVLTVGSVNLNAASPSLSSFSSRGPVLRTDTLGLGTVANASAPYLAGAAVITLDKPDVLAPGGEMTYQAMAGQCAHPQGQGVMSAKATGVGTPWTTCAHASEPYASCSGTSMSAPVVAGLAALILEYANSNGLALSQHAQRAIIIYNIIRATARDLGLARSEQGYGLVDWANIEQTLARIGSGEDYLDNYLLPPVFPR